MKKESAGSLNMPNDDRNPNQLFDPPCSRAEFAIAWKGIAIVECGEPLVSIPGGPMEFFLPHPYKEAGAPYGDASPWQLRSGVVDRLLQAQSTLAAANPGYCLRIFDGYRPLAVQFFMVEYTLRSLAAEQGLTSRIDEEDVRKRLLGEVFQLFAVPTEDPAQPPPHSTGAAVDLTIVDESGALLDMGSPIDAMPPLSWSNAFAGDPSAEGRARHRNRELLKTVMESAGFRRLPYEWWHFSYGDQRWAALNQISEGKTGLVACYGRVS